MEPAELIKIKKDIGAKVAAAIGEHKYTLYFIQKNTGVKIANIQAVIKGDKNYTIETLLILGKFLHLSKLF
jgi:hypothetical protein